MSKSRILPMVGWSECLRVCHMHQREQGVDLAEGPSIGTVACQGDGTLCVLRPCVLRPWVFLVHMSAPENVAVVGTLPRHLHFCFH